MPSERKRRSRSPKEKRRKDKEREKDKTARQERKRKKETDTAEEPESPPRKDRREERKEERKEEERKDRREEEERKEDRRQEEGERAPSPQNEGGEEEGGQSGEVSMGVEDMNKLREKLGLKPLETDTGTTIVESETDPGDRIITEEGKTFTHRAPGNWGDKRKELTIREKLAVAREKRRLLDGLGSSGLADGVEEDSAAAWVEKTRRAEEERKAAEVRARALQEMDETFGVGELIQKDAKKKKDRALRASGSRLPAGMRVEHSKEAFLDGNETILVLKDKGVLDEDDSETLVNPTLVELDQWKRNAEIRKKKPGYNPYSDCVDEDGNLKERGVLDKYDEELLENGGLPKKETFAIDQSGTIDVGPERRLAEIKAKLREGKNAMMHSVETAKYEPAREYYTPEEMASFKKPRKKKDKQGLRKKTGLKADDLVLAADSAPTDFGSRDRGKGKKKAAFEGERPEGTAKEEEGALEDLLPAPHEVEDDDDDLYGPDGDLAGVLVEDEAEDELQAVLDRARKLKSTTVKEETADAGEAVVKLMSSEPEVKREVEEEGEEDEAKITMDATSEYCRHLGDIPTLGPVPTAIPTLDDDEEERPTRRKKKSRKDEDERGRKKSKWRSFEGQTDMDTAEDGQGTHREESSDSESDLEELLGGEASASSSVAAAIKLATQKGYLETTKPGDEAKLKDLECKRFSQVDRQFQDIDDKYARKLERMGMGGGPVRSFDDKRDYKPSVNLTYCDELGRQMDTKQAFRFMSWKFHGKRPGKMKTEKRRVKAEEAEKVTRLDSSDTPLGTLAKQKKKQEREGLPYVPLSGPATQLNLPKD